jgi:hypothetical protein
MSIGDSRYWGASGVASHQLCINVADVLWMVYWLKTGARGAARLEGRAQQVFHFGGQVYWLVRPPFIRKV